MKLNELDLTLSLSKEDYEAQLHQEQLRLFRAMQKLENSKQSVVLVFEGWDAAGKGGAIRRLTENLNPHNIIAHSIAAPQGEDKTHHYLYRFWRRLPERGQLAIFDRSWYGRVLVERVEGFCREEAWQRAFDEINAFEAQLQRQKVLIAKFWLHVSHEEQERRFEGRAGDPLKSWKLTDEDWRNRAKWPQYLVAVEDMLAKTSPETAPWTLIEGDDKRYARVKVVRTVANLLEPLLSER